jgi:hypothetical protein
MPLMARRKFSKDRLTGRTPGGYHFYYLFVGRECDLGAASFSIDLR